MDLTIVAYLIGGCITALILWFCSNQPKIADKTEEVRSEADRIEIDSLTDTLRTVIENKKDLEIRHMNTSDALNEYKAENKDLRVRLLRCEGGNPPDDEGSGPDYRPK